MAGNFGAENGNSGHGNYNGTVGVSAKCMLYKPLEWTTNSVVQSGMGYQGA